MKLKTLVILLAIGGAYVAGKSWYEDSGRGRENEPFTPYWNEAGNPSVKPQIEKATFTVHKVVPYNGPATVKPYPYARHVAVDLEIQGRGDGFDLDDIDVIDGATGESYGSDPDMIGVSLDGTQVIHPDKWPEDTSRYRGLFIYVVRKKTTSIQLGYWGHMITKAATPITESGKIGVSPKPEEIYMTGSR